MKIASIANMKARVRAYLKETKEWPVIVTRNGKAVAVLAAVPDDDELERLVLAIRPGSRPSWRSRVVRSRRPAASRTARSGARRASRRKPDVGAISVSVVDVHVGLTPRRSPSFLTLRRSGKSNLPRKLHPARCVA
jgi:hypothetical protein